MTAEKLAAQIPVLAPLAHLLVSFLFLAGYSAGFGGGIGQFFSLSDLFTITLSNIVLIYFTGLLPPLIMIAPRFRPGYRTYGQKILEQSPERFDKYIKSERRRSSMMIGLVALIQAPMIFLTIHFDQRIPYFEMSFLETALVTRCCLWYAEKLPTAATTDLIASSAISMIFAAYLAGVGTGQGERRYPPSAFDHRVTCGQYVILRPASGKYIVTDHVGHRKIVGPDCKVAFDIPDRPNFQDVGGIDLAKQFYQEIRR